MKEKTQLNFDSILENSDNKIWAGHFRVPESIARVFIQGNDRRVVCTLNGQVRYQCGLLPYGEGDFVITVNAKIRDKLRLQPGSVLQICLEKDESEYGLPMPEEFAEVLAQDEEGNRLFHALTPGKIRTLLYTVGQVKSTDKRISRALKIVEHLKMMEGKIDYKVLNAALKEKD